MPDNPLERRDLVAHRRLRIPELSRSPGEGLGPCNGPERGHLAQVEVTPDITRWNQSAVQPTDVKSIESSLGAYRSSLHGVSERKLDRSG